MQYGYYDRYHFLGLKGNFCETFVSNQQILSHRVSGEKGPSFALVDKRCMGTISYI